MTASALLVLLVAVLLIVWLYDFDKPVKKLAEMANSEVSLQHRSHKQKMIKKTMALDVSAEDVEKAKANAALLDSFDIN